MAHIQVAREGAVATIEGLDAFFGKRAAVFA